MHSSTEYWISGLSTTGSISLGSDLVAGSERVPSPAAGSTALRTRRGDGLDMVDVRGARRVCAPACLRARTLVPRESPPYARPRKRVNADVAQTSVCGRGCGTDFSLWPAEVAQSLVSSPGTGLPHSASLFSRGETRTNPTARSTS